jgi:hypothetical protein
MKLKKNVNEAVTKLLVERLKKKADGAHSLDKTTCLEIYQDIFFTIAEIIKTAEIPLSNESVNLLSQMYYDSVVVNGNQELDPNIFDKRASLDNIPTKDVAMLAVVTEGSPFFPIFMGTIKRRQ